MFDDGKVASERLAAEGFAASKYTLSFGEGEALVWESMMRSEAAGIVFWHAELQRNAIRGVFSKRAGGEAHQDFSFSGAETSGKTVRLPATATAAMPLGIATEAPTTPQGHH